MKRPKKPRAVETPEGRLVVVPEETPEQYAEGMKLAHEILARAEAKPKRAPKKRPTQKEKLEALKGGVELPVDIDTLWRVKDPDVEERAVLELARAIHRARSRGCAISWDAQVEAARYYNAHGLAETLDEMFRLEALALPGADA